jgi:hypothetical protein
VDAHCRLIEVLDKGKAASLTAIVYTTDKHTGQVIFENQTTLVIRGSGGFGGKRIGNGKQITTGRFGVVLGTLFMVQIGGRHLRQISLLSENLMRYSRRRRRHPKPHCTGACTSLHFISTVVPHHKEPCLQLERRSESIARALDYCTSCKCITHVLT